MYRERDWGIYRCRRHCHSGWLWLWLLGTHTHPAIRIHIIYGMYTYTFIQPTGGGGGQPPDSAGISNKFLFIASKKIKFHF